MCLLITVVLFFIAYKLYQHFHPSPDIKPEEKYVLITGCDSGFGHGLAIELDKRGFNVLACVLNETSRASLTECLSSRATVFCLDITKQDQIDSVYQLVKEKTNVLHALVNNAGISENGRIDWMPTSTMRKLMDVNFFGHVAMTKKFIPLLIVKRDSRVVYVSSTAGIITLPGTAAYSASKHAIESFSDCLRREMAVWNLRVSIIEPGAMKTPIVEGHDRLATDMWAKLPDDVKERWGEQIFQNELKMLRDNPIIKTADNPQVVVEALRHAVMNTKPKLRYRPGWQSPFLFYPFSLCPAWFIDFLLAMSRSKSAIPAGVSKQMPN